MAFNLFSSIGFPVGQWSSNWCASHSLEDLLKKEFLIQYVWKGAWESVFLRISQMVLMLLVQRPHLENHHYKGITFLTWSVIILFTLRAKAKDSRLFQWVPRYSQGLSEDDLSSASGVYFFRAWSWCRKAKLVWWEVVGARAASCWEPAVSVCCLDFLSLGYLGFCQVVSESGVPTALDSDPSIAS